MRVPINAELNKDELNKSMLKKEEAKPVNAVTSAKLSVHANATAEKKIAPKRTPPRLLRVVNILKLTPHLQRISLSGDALIGFPVGRNGAHIKVFIPRPGQSEPVLPKLGAQGIEWPAADLRPITRTYGVRYYCAKQNRLDIDFVLHGTECPASGWAHKAKIGDALGIAGPGGPDPLLAPAGWHLLVGDITAVPAIAAILEGLPSGSQAEVIIQLEHWSDCLTFNMPDGVHVHWVITATVSAKAKILEKLSALAPPPGASVSAFVAGENGCVVAVRDYLRRKYGLTKSHLYAVPYWRFGQDEETYHQERHRVMDEVY